MSKLIREPITGIERIKVVNYELTEDEILKFADDSGCDMDGDIITIDGVNYFVDINDVLVRRV